MTVACSSLHPLWASLTPLQIFAAKIANPWIKSVLGNFLGGRFMIG